MWLIKVLVGILIWFLLCRSGIHPFLSAIVTVVGIWKFWKRNKGEDQTCIEGP